MRTELKFWLVLSASLVLAVSCAFGFTKVGNAYTTTGEFADVKAAVADAAASGDVVNIPAGTFNSWGTGGAISTGKSITIQGASRTSTILNGATGGPTIFNFSGTGVVVQGFTFNGGSAGTIVFNLTGTAGNTVGLFNDLKLDFGTDMGSRMFFSTGVYYVCANSELKGGGGNNEYIYALGPSTAWNVPHGAGGPDAIYIENCDFTGPGYPDINAAGRAVFRFNRVTTTSKFDGHGSGSNQNAPVRGVRLIEAYYNYWSNTANTSWTCMEWRGGSLFCFGNRAWAKNGFWPNLYLRCYEVESRWSLFSQIWQTPTKYPIPDQIGAGPGTRVFNGFGTQQAAVEPGYLWDNAKGAGSSLSDWAVNWKDGSSITYTTNSTVHTVGTTVINLAAAGGSLTKDNYIAFAGDTNRYRVAVDKTSTSTTITIASPGLLQELPASPITVTAGPQTNYQGETGNHLNTFTTKDHIIVANRDFYWGAYNSSGFTGSSGIGRGTKAEMLAITSATTNVGFVVSNEGGWNNSVTGTIAASAIENWDYCEIVSLGDTNWGAIGCFGTPAVGSRFVAFGPGSGTGTVKAAQGDQLYTWNGTDWALKYGPYPYPHPLRATGPDVTAPVASAEIDPDGVTFRLILSEACTGGVNGTGGITLDASNGPVTATYSGGNGTTIWLYALNRTVIPSDVVTWDYSLVNGIEDAAGNDLAPVDNGAVNNRSTQSVIDAPANPWRSSVLPGIY